MDTTYNVNIEGYPLFAILAEEGDGRGKPVAYCYFRSESKEHINKVLEKFCEHNDVTGVRIVMVGKDPILKFWRFVVFFLVFFFFFLCVCFISYISFALICLALIYYLYLTHHWKRFVHSCWSCNKALDLLKPCFNLIFPSWLSLACLLLWPEAAAWCIGYPAGLTLQGSLVRSCGLSNESINRGLVSTT